MSNVPEQILTAADTLITAAVSRLKYDRTIKAEVYGIKDLDSGEYKVKYEGSVFSAFSNNLEVTYEIGELVFVTIPDGDFSNKKIITAVFSGRSLSETEMAKLQNLIRPVSPTFDQLYKGTKGVIYDAQEARSVIAGIPEGDKGSYAVVYKDTDLQYTAKYHGLFMQYARQYENIRIRGSFLTKFHSIHNTGRYGLKIEFYAKNDTVVEYILDNSSFNGDPYRFSNYAPQSIIIKVEKDYLIGLKSITFFEKDFKYDTQIINKEEIKENRTQANIFCKDIYLDFVEIKDLSDVEYYLTIDAPNGTCFANSAVDPIIKLDLIGSLKYRGKDILEASSCSCQWFRQDPSIMIGHEEYNKDAGFGWKPIESNFNKLSLEIKDVPYKQKYKLLVIYNEKVKLTAEIKITNSSSPYNFELIQLDGRQSELGKIYIALKQYNGPKDISGDWYVSYPDGSYQEVREEKRIDMISVDSLLIYSPLTFYCGVYTSDNEYLGCLDITINSIESEEDISIKYSGSESIYRYDANGDITYEDSEKERYLIAEINLKESVGVSYTVSWVMQDEEGNELEIPKNTRPGLNPPSSMVQDVWVDNYNILHYNIKQKYSVNNINNLFIVKIKTVMDKEYFFRKEILFIKDGDQGTSGLTYIAAIRPCAANLKDKLTGVQPLVYTTTWSKGVKLRCFVYKDGEPIDSLKGISAEYKWEGVNVSLTKNNDIVDVRGTELPRSDGQYYVKVQVTIKDNDRRTPLNIYALYPIDVVVGAIDYKNLDISNIPSYIKYTSSGINPLFYSNNIYFKYNNDSYDDIDQIPGITSLTKDILQLQDKNGTYLKPADSFIFEEDCIGAIKCSISSTQYIIHPIVLYLDTYGNSNINGWDGTKLLIHPGDDQNPDEYIYAPQIGAGEKDSANRFTGIIMGKDNSSIDSISGKKLVGLYGYQSGVNTFGLLENGRAFFGRAKGGGRIIIDGESAVIYGGDIQVRNNGDIEAAPNGMYLRLAKVNEPGKTKAIGIGYNNNSREENFFVTYDGKLKATEADIQGTIYAVKGQIGGTDRSGGWEIEQWKLQSGTGSNHVELNSDPYCIYAFFCGGSYRKDESSTQNGSRADFSVTKDGKVTAKSGTIGGWNLTSKTLFSTNGSSSTGMGSSTRAVFWAGSGLSEDSDSLINNTGFLVTRNGKMYCKSADISGKITADSGKIGEWEIKDGKLQNEDGNISISPREINFKNRFIVDSSGNVECSSLDIKGGEISIGDDRGNGFYVNNEGYLKMGNGAFTVDPEGNLTCRKVTELEINHDNSGDGGLSVDYITINDNFQFYGDSTLGRLGYFYSNITQDRVFGLEGPLNEISTLILSRSGPLVMRCSSGNSVRLEADTSGIMIQFGSHSIYCDPRGWITIDNETQCPLDKIKEVLGT